MSASSPLTLFVLRHGKASDYADTDFNRPLTKKGQQQATEKGALLKQRLPFIDIIFCSAAIRTLETLEYAHLDTRHSDVFIKKELYLCSPEVLMNNIHQIDRGKTALIIGHNPGIHQFAYDLLPSRRQHHSEQEDALAISFPKCALAEFHFSCNDWSEVNWHQGSLIAYDR